MSRNEQRIPIPLPQLYSGRIAPCIRRNSWRDARLRHVSALAQAQFIAFVISFYFVLQFVLTSQGCRAATVSVRVKIVLLRAITIAGMLWEKDVYNHYFMAREFFREDFGNLIAMITHNAYFVVRCLGCSERDVMLVMLFAYCTYLFNFSQFTVKYFRSLRQRYALANRCAI